MLVWHSALELTEHTLFLALFIFDKYTHKKRIEFCQLVPIILASLFIAIKFEEITIYSARFFVYNCGIENFCRDDLLLLEEDILSTLDFDIIYPCPYDILRRLVFIFNGSQQLGKINKLTYIYIYIKFNYIFFF